MSAKRSMMVILGALLIGAILALAPSWAQSSTRDGQSYGWTVQTPPVSPENLDRPLTELERLSLSSSGSGFAESIYNIVSDNPLVPISVTLRALDKITAQFIDLTIPVGETQDFGKLRILARTCNKRPPEEEPETSAFLEIIDLDALAREEKQARELAEAEAAEALANGEEDRGPEAMEPSQPEARSLLVEDVDPDAIDMVAKESGPDLSGFDKVEAIFRGWMFASSPALNAVDHPVYDVWVIDCKMVEPSQ